jgi:hypothetical protein
LRRGKVTSLGARGISSDLGHEDLVLQAESGPLDQRSGAAGDPFASMGCPIVNALFTHNSVWNTKPSLPRQWWNSAPSNDGQELPPYPRHYPGPWLGPLSFIVRHTPVGPPCIVRPVGTFATVARGKATNNMSQFRWRHTRRRRVLLIRPAGFMIAVDNPM